MLSLQVGEHLPDSCLATYIELLTSTAGSGILLAWSLMHTGHCHINTKDTGSIACTLGYHGFVRDNAASHRVRARAKIGWLRKDFRVYRRAAL